MLYPYDDLANRCLQPLGTRDPLLPKQMLSADFGSGLFRDRLARLVRSSSFRADHEASKLGRKALISWGLRA